MPTITALSQVTSNELIGLDNAYVPVVSSGQTKKLRFKDLRETVVPKVLQQAVAGNSDELTFNNPSSLKVDVYGRVTAVTEGGGTPIRIEGVQLDALDFEGGGTAINQGTAYITHKVRFPLAAGDFSILPPFKSNKSGHLTDGSLVSDPTLYNIRANAQTTKAAIGLGAAIAPPEVDPDIQQLFTTVEAGNIPGTFEEYASYYRALVAFSRKQEKVLFEVLDRVNRISYLLKEFNLAFLGGYIGASDTVNTEHRSRYTGIYNFIPLSPADSVTNPWASAGLATSSNYYVLSLYDGFSPEGIFSSPLALAPTESASARIWQKLRIDAVFVPLAAFLNPAQFSFGGYTGTVQSITRTYEFTQTTMNAGSGTGWTTSTVGGVKYVNLQTPTVAQLRAVNSSFGTGANNAAVNSDSWLKNQLLMTLQYSGVANAEWIPSATNAALPNTANTGLTKTISFGSSALFAKSIDQTP